MPIFFARRRAVDFERELEDDHEVANDQEIDEDQDITDDHEMEDRDELPKFQQGSLAPFAEMGERALENERLFMNHDLSIDEDLVQVTHGGSSIGEDDVSEKAPEHMEDAQDDDEQVCTDEESEIPIPRANKRQRQTKKQSFFENDAVSTRSSPAPSSTVLSDHKASPRNPKQKQRADSIASNESDDSASSETQWEVEKIVDSRIEAGTLLLYYRVKWKGFDDRENTWEPLDNLTNCQAAIDDYENEVAAASLSKHKREKSKKKQQRMEKEPRQFQIEVKQGKAMRAKEKQIQEEDAKKQLEEKQAKESQARQERAKRRQVGN